MVSLWPWRKGDDSPASFEKTLSTLSAKITKTTLRTDSFRRSLRRLKALWTLYAGFAYLLCFVILVLVVGWRNWGATEYMAVAGGPAVIYLIRLGLTTYYDYRISNQQDYVEGLQKERDKTIDKLKSATKYNTTQQLLEKYGGAPAKKKASTTTGQMSPPRKQGQQRTSFIPPPTANISNRQPVSSLPNTPARSPTNKSPFGPPPPQSASASIPPWQQNSPPQSSTAEFAPNAFSSAPQYEYADNGPRWYDRFMDVLLGEDESHPKNRIVLVCKQCRLVNGQAPPGIKQVEDIGRWRCSACGAMNGEESEARKIVSALHAREKSEPKREVVLPKEMPASPQLDGSPDEGGPAAGDEDGHSDVTQYSDDELEEREMAAGANVKSEEAPEDEAPKRRSGRLKESKT